MPSLPADIIQRNRVVTALEEALSSRCLVVLTAPPGHGKSTAAQQLLGRWKTRSLYLRIRPGWEDNAEYLWNDLCARLEEQSPGLAPPGMEPLRLAGFPNDDARMYRCLTFFREYLSAAPTLLVLDDYHYADAPPWNRFIESLVNEEIPGFNLLLLSRTKPGLPLAYMQVEGYAAVLDSALLDFTGDEARRLFDQAGEHDAEAADKALQFSRGWAAALRVCLRSHMAGDAATPAGTMDDLLSDTFFMVYSREDQCLLLQLSIMDSFTPAQAAFLSGRKDAPLRLRKLHERSAFLQYSPSSDTCAIHALLRSFLHRILAENPDAVCRELDIPLLYRRAGECGLDAKDFLQAIQFFARAGREEDLLRILQVFETPGEGFFMLPAHEAVTRIMEDIPWKIRFLSPIGYLGFIHRHAVRISRAQAEGMAREAEARFLAEGALPETVQRVIRGEIQLIRAILRFNDIKAVFRCYAKADELLQGRSRLVNRNMFWTYNCPHSAFLYLREPGGYEDLERLAADNLAHFQNVSGGANAGAVELLQAERSLETGKFHKTAELLQTAKYKALEDEQHTAMVAVNFTSARLLLAEGRAGDVYELLETLRAPVERRAHPLLLHNLEVCLGYIGAVCNDPERIPSWLTQQEPLTVRNNQAHSFTLVVRGKAIMALRNWPRLLAFAEKTEPEMRGLGCLFGRVHVLLFKAVATANMQQRNASLSETYLARALDLAGPDGILTSIAEYGAHLFPLLQRFANLHPERRDLVKVSRLTKHYAGFEKARASALTPRETGIMELVRQGANNREIGGKLGITQGSVANSLSRIYVKLGVGSRIEAMNKWSEESALE